LNQVIAAMDEMTDQELSTVLDQMHPAQNGAIALSQENLNAQVSQLFSRHENWCCCPLLDGCKQQGNYFWAQPFGNIFRVNPENELQIYHTETAGLAVGIEHLFNPNNDVGIAIGYEQASLRYQNQYGKAVMNDLFLALYTDLGNSYFQVNLALKGGVDFIENSRSMQFESANASFIADYSLTGLANDLTAESSFKAFEAAVHIGVKFKIPLWFFCVKPFGSIDGLGIFMNGYTEEGASVLDLTVKHKDDYFLRSQGGILLTKTFETKNGKICPEIGCGYARVLTYASDQYVANFSNISNQFTTKGKNQSWSLLTPQAAINYSHKNGSSIGVHYQVDFENRYVSNQLDLNISYKF